MYNVLEYTVKFFVRELYVSIYKLSTVGGKNKSLTEMYVSKLQDYVGLIISSPDEYHTLLYSICEYINAKARIALTVPQYINDLTDAFIPNKLKNSFTDKDRDILACHILTGFCKGYCVKEVMQPHVLSIIIDNRSEDQTRSNINMLFNIGMNSIITSQKVWHSKFIKAESIDSKLETVTLEEYEKLLERSRNLESKLYDYEEIIRQYEDKCKEYQSQLNVFKEMASKLTMASKIPSTSKVSMDSELLKIKDIPSYTNDTTERERVQDRGSGYEPIRSYEKTTTLEPTIESKNSTPLYSPIKDVWADKKNQDADKETDIKEDKTDKTDKTDKVDQDSDGEVNAIDVFF